VFSLWNAPTAGTAIGPQLQLFNATLVRGLLTVDLNFGDGSFNGEGRWLEIAVRNEAVQFADALFEATVTVTVTARSGEKTVFLAEVAQAGIFSARGIAPQDLEPLLGIGCPTILFPYAREAISDLVTRAGFPAVVLAPVSFEQIYMQRQQQAAAEPRIELAS